MKTAEQIEIEATEMAMSCLDDLAAKLGFQPDENGIWSEEAAERVLAHCREWITKTEAVTDAIAPDNA